MLENRWYAVLKASDLPIGGKPTGIRRLGTKFVLWRTDEGVVCFDDRCPHKGVELNSGKLLAGGGIRCPYHAFEFDKRGKCNYIPANGRDGAIPKGMELRSRPVREEHGLIWLWWGEERDSLPPVPWYHELLPDSALPHSASHARVFPLAAVRYTETLLEVYHTCHLHWMYWPFGPGPRVEDYKVSVDGERIESTGFLANESKTRKRRFRLQCILPGLVAMQMWPSKDVNLIAITPVDDENTWIFSRYYHSYLKVPLLGKAVSAAFLHSEWELLQKIQDVGIQSTRDQSFPDGEPYRYVAADGGSALFLRMMAERMEAQRAEVEA